MHCASTLLDSLGLLGTVRISFGVYNTDSEVDLDYHVQISALPRPAGEAELWEFASELHTAALDRSRPLWQMHLIEGLADGRYALYLKTHPALADGVGRSDSCNERCSRCNEEQ